MSCSLQTPYFLLCLGLLLLSGEAQVLTESQAGPLYRVVGSRLSIFCNVSGVPSHSTASQNFDFRFLPSGSSPSSSPLNIISTQSKSFGYAMFKKRVANGEIKLTHTSPTSVVFEIQALQKSDEGEFQCLLVNPVSRYYGVYSASTAVKVIDDSLSVSFSPSAALSYNEGEALSLSCQASSNTLQHTHLSLGWYLHKNGEDSARPIISLNRDFTLTPGPGFEGRHHAGLIRLDKVGETTYKLEMTKLEESDKGKIYCQAQEWIQDPDRSWYSIAQKDSEKSTLSVKAKEVGPKASLPVVRLTAQPSLLQEGQELSLSCNIDAQNLQERFFSVAWLRGDVELARIGPTGILSVGPEHRGREKDFRAARLGSRDYRLTLQPVRTEDQGKYICRVWPEDRGQDGIFTQGISQDSTSELVNISATESGISVEMTGGGSVNEGDSLMLTCKVNGAQGQLSVVWQHKSLTGGFSNIIGLNQEGTVENSLTGRSVTASRPATDTFTLKLEEVTPADAGVYQCDVSEWRTNSKIISQTQTVNVNVTPIESLVKLVLFSRNSIATLGADLELTCQVRGPRIPMTLSWGVQRDESLDNILTMYSDGSISWSGEQQRYQLRVQKSQNGLIHYLAINGAGHREAGRYQCSAVVFLKNGPKNLAPSNMVAVIVQDPESKLTLAPDPSLRHNINTDIQMKCAVTSEPSPNSRYAVTWLLMQQAENKTILSSDQNALVTFGSTLEQSYRQRISMRRTSGPTFQLSIRQARTSDEGLYICEVVEWLQTSKSQWYPLPPVSETIQLTLIEPANDLQLDQAQRSLAAKEGDEVKLECDIITGAFSPSLFYKVSWLYTRKNSVIENALVELDHTGLLSYPQTQGLRGLQERLRLSRPTQRSFFLHIQRGHEEDSGTYKCLIEQYHLDNEGQWQQKASQSAGPIVLTVYVPGKNLSISQEEVESNVSRSQDFTIPCQITQQSSVESEFQVTWFFQEATETKGKPIFRANRDSTLQMFGRGDQLRFSHPLPKQFNLTVLKPGLENSGMYFCEVEEWIPSLSHSWRKVAVERSGYFTVNLYAGGDAETSIGTECRSNTLLGILIAIIGCMFLVIFILLLKMCRRKEEKKSQKSLWTEQHPLNTKSSADD